LQRSRNGKEQLNWWTLFCHRSLGPIKYYSPTMNFNFSKYIIFTILFTQGFISLAQIGNRAKKKVQKKEIEKSKIL